MYKLVCVWVLHNKLSYPTIYSFLLEQVPVNSIIQGTERDCWLFFLSSTKKEFFFQIEQTMFPQIESEMSDLQKEIEKGLVPAKPRGIWASYASMEQEINYYFFCWLSKKDEAIGNFKKKIITIMSEKEKNLMSLNEQYVMYVTVFLFKRKRLIWSFNLIVKCNWIPKRSLITSLIFIYF